MSTQPASDPFLRAAVPAPSPGTADDSDTPLDLEALAAARIDALAGIPDSMPLDPATLLRGDDRRQLAGVQTSRPRRFRRLRAQPHWLDALVEVHAAARRPLPVAIDAVLVYLACLVAGVGGPVPALAWTAGLVIACYVGQVYADRDSVQTQGVLWFLVRPITPLVTVGFLASATGTLPPVPAAMMVGISLALVVGLRCVLWPLLVMLRRRGLALRRTLIVGADETASRLWQRLVEFPEAGLVPVQMLDWGLVESADTLRDEVERHHIAHIVLVTHRPERLRLTGRLRGESERRVRFSLVPVFAELFVNPATMTTVASIPLLPLGQVMRLRRGYAGKRALDVLGSLCMLILASPLMLLTALAIKLDDAGPIFYKQSRVGVDGRTFHMIKFRSMRVGADRMVADLAADNASDGLLFKLRTDPRVTRVGRVIRRLSIDELPQLLNVLIGEMSLVGPRPLPVAPEEFDAWDNERHATLPGITGYWQISGGTALGYDEMVRLDLAYVRNASLSLDLRLLLRTVPALLHRKGPT